MKSVLISVNPKWCDKIASGEKTIEVRKSAPKEVPFKAYIYETKGATETPWVDEDGHYIYKGKGQVIGEFICDKVYLIKNQGNSFVVANEEQGVTNEIARQSCLDYDDMVSYLGNKDGYGWYISDLKIYDEPKALSCFYKQCSKNTTCSTCDWLHVDWHTFGECSNTVTRPPQSYMFVEEA